MDKNKIIIIALVMLVILAASFVIRNYYNDYNQLSVENGDLKETIEAYNKTIANLETEKAELEVKNKILADEMKNSKEKIEALEQTNAASYKINDFYVQDIEEQGYTTDEILNDLNNQNDLIPFDGVLGGTMSWWSGNSYVLTNKYVLGYFEDGHIMGYGLLEYQLKEDTIEWKLIDAHLH